MKNLIISVTLFAGTLMAAAQALPTGNLVEVVPACAGAAAPKPAVVKKPVKEPEARMCGVE